MEVVKKVPRILDGDKYFKILSTDKNGKISARCVPCGAKNKTINGCVTATSNFVTHLKRSHANLHREYEEEGRDPEYAAKRIKQNVLPFPVTVISHVETKSHRSILRFIVNTMSPLAMVGNPFLKQLVKDLNSEASIQSQNTLKAQITVEFMHMLDAVKKKLALATWVGCTSDIWSTKSRSFLGVTGHWLEPDLGRSSVILALKRFPGTHSHDRIAGKLKDVLLEFGIQTKTIGITTDNGSNFVKAFKEFGLDSEILEPDTECEEDEEEVALAEMPELDFLLPEHFRCASHTLSLVATCDLEKEKKKQVPTTCKPKDGEQSQNATSYATVKKLMRSTFAKCCALWNKVGRSPKISEAIKTCLGSLVERPCPTRWNSTFDAVTCLLKHKDKLDEVFELAGLEILSATELEFLEDYAEAMKPLATALDVLQSEKQIYFGHYAPIIVNLKNELDALITASAGNGFCWAIASSLRDGLQHRFEAILNFDLTLAKTAILASVTMPCLKLRWIPQEFRENVKDVFVEVLSEFIDETPVAVHDKNQNCSNSFDIDIWDKMFGKSGDGESYPVEVQALQFLNDQNKDISILDSHPSVKKMFIKYNTPLPSSAPSERLFSYGGMILRPKRSRLTDEMFEMLALLKLNQQHYPL